MTLSAKNPVARMINETYELCRGRFESADVTFAPGNIPEDLICECRRVQVSQIIFNLLVNAQQAAADHTDPWVKIQVTKVGDHIEIRIIDSGKPIDLSLQNKIFEPFFTTKEVGDGVGLGLSTAKGMVESHNGSLTLDLNSTSTTFVIRLPIKQDETTMQAS